MESLVAERGTEHADPERRLWVAVLLQAIQEWQVGALRISRAAEQFLFENEEDFEMVCQGAGIEPSSIRQKLARLPKRRDNRALPFRLPVR
jgi:hypothetical protein